MPVYLELFHGRASTTEKMDDWGEPGPVLGPFRFVHSTYAQDIKMEPDAQDGNFIATEDPNRACELAMFEGLVYYDGMWYGDFSVFGKEVFRGTKELMNRHQVFMIEKTYPPQRKGE